MEELRTNNKYIKYTLSDQQIKEYYNAYSKYLIKITKYTNI